MDVALFMASVIGWRFHHVHAAKPSPPLSYKLLQQQDAETSTAIIDYFNQNQNFIQLSKYEEKLTLDRDKEDDEKLAVGIQFAKDKKVIDPNFQPEPYIRIDVLGKTPSQVADIIVQQTRNTKLGVIVLVGLSGTGKGTTVAMLRQKLEQNEGKKVVTWSNGNVFRSVTLLAATYCEQQGLASFDKDKALTKENIASFMKMLTFGKFGGKFDIRIHGLGLDMLVSQVQNTALKGPKVSKNIPTVAQFTQGEVIMFAAKAVETMGKDGIFVLLEGRQQTVDYVRSPHRFALTLSDESIIGQRRAAQRIMGEARTAVSPSASAESVGVALTATLAKLVTEMH